MALMMVVAFVPRLRERVNGIPALRRCGDALSGHVLRHEKWWVIAALLIGVAVRLWRFPELPRGVNWDGMMAGIEGMSLARGGTDQYGTAWPVYFEAWQHAQMNVLYSYLLIPFVKLWGLSRLTLRLPMMIISLAALPVIWDFARRLKGRAFALIVLWLTVLCPWQITTSRWALESNLMGHFLLFSCYLLYLGLSKKPFLYIGMAMFGVTMYAYGVAAYSVPVLLILVCAYLLWAKRIRRWEALCCALVYLLVSLPFFLMLFINAFGLETIRLGPVTIQYFAESVRAEDLVFFAENPLRQALENLGDLMEVSLLQTEGTEHHTYPLSRTLYVFSVPALWAGIFLMIRDGHRARAKSLEPQWQDGATLVCCWLASMILCGIITNGTNVNRANGIFYPLLICLGYGLWQAVRRVRVLALLMALCYAVGFGTYCVGYFTDAEYIDHIATRQSDGLVEALDFAHELDCDRYYVSNSLLGDWIMEKYVWFAHEIDPAQHQGEREVADASGNEMGYYDQRYQYMPFQDFVPDPEECTAYILSQAERQWFSADDFILWNFGMYAVAYPLHWYE